jgi:hypothetical protein
MRLAATAVLAAGALALLGGCSGSMLADHLPTAAGGLPADAPARPDTDGTYPAVHNMPPARGQPLSSDQQKQVEDELIAARNRYGGGANAPTSTGSIPANPKASSAQNP